MSYRFTAPTTTRAPTRGLARAPHRLAALLSLSVLGACAATPPADPQGAAAGGEPALGAATVPAPTLYDELGGASGVEALTEQFIREIAADERIRGRYRDTDIGRFHRMMKEQMCMRTGGGCEYTGDDMKRTHAGMDIQPNEFNAIVEALMRAMDEQGLPVSTQNRLLSLYAPMRAEIIDR